MKYLLMNVSGSQSQFTYQYADYILKFIFIVGLLLLSGEELICIKHACFNYCYIITLFGVVSDVKATYEMGTYCWLVVRAGCFFS